MGLNDLLVSLHSGMVDLSLPPSSTSPSSPPDDSDVMDCFEMSDNDDIAKKCYDVLPRERMEGMIERGKKTLLLPQLRDGKAFTWPCNQQELATRVSNLSFTGHDQLDEIMRQILQRPDAVRLNAAILLMANAFWSPEEMATGFMPHYLCRPFHRRHVTMYGQPRPYYRQFHQLFKQLLGIESDQEYDSTKSGKHVGASLSVNYKRDFQTS